MEFAYGNITAKHSKNIVTKIFHDSVGEEEYYAYSAQKLMKFDTLDDLEAFKNSKNKGQKTAVADYFESHDIKQYAVIRVRIER